MGGLLFLENIIYNPGQTKRLNFQTPLEIRQLGFKQQPRKSQREVRRTRSRHLGRFQGVKRSKLRIGDSVFL